MFDQLSAEFPREAISWRAQSVNKEGTKALALAYIDARDVMERLDAVVGPGNWQDRYEFSGPRTICYLSIRVGEEWITKADGAGDTDVEAEKGAISDAFKRAAVKWGIGRYLYDLDAPWVPCECSEWQGKKRWKRWTANPWSFVKGAANTPADQGTSPKPSAAHQKRELDEIQKELLDCVSILAVDNCAKTWQFIAKRDGWSRDYIAAAAKLFSGRREAIQQSETDDFPGDAPDRNAIKNNAYAQAAMAG